MTGRCPVCRRDVAPTEKNNVYRHRDRAGKHCPASGYPMRITEVEQ